MYDSEDSIALEVISSISNMLSFQNDPKVQDQCNELVSIINTTAKTLLSTDPEECLNSLITTQQHVPSNYTHPLLSQTAQVIDVVSRTMETLTRHNMELVVGTFESCVEYECNSEHTRSNYTNTIRNLSRSLLSLRHRVIGPEFAKLHLLTRKLRNIQLAMNCSCALNRLQKAVCHLQQCTRRWNTDSSLGAPPPPETAQGVRKTEHLSSNTSALDAGDRLLSVIAALRDVQQILHEEHELLNGLDIVEQRYRPWINRLVAMLSTVTLPQMFRSALSSKDVPAVEQAVVALEKLDILPCTLQGIVTDEILKPSEAVLRRELHPSLLCSVLGDIRTSRNDLRGITDEMWVLCASKLAAAMYYIQDTFRSLSIIAHVLFVHSCDGGHVTKDSIWSTVVNPNRDHHANVNQTLSWTHALRSHSYAWNYILLPRLHDFFQKREQDDSLSATLCVFFPHVASLLWHTLWGIDRWNLCSNSSNDVRCSDEACPWRVGKVPRESEGSQKEDEIQNVLQALLDPFYTMHVTMHVLPGIKQILDKTFYLPVHNLSSKNQKDPDAPASHIVADSSIRSNRKILGGDSAQNPGSDCFDPHALLNFFVRFVNDFFQPIPAPEAMNRSEMHVSIPSVSRIAHTRNLLPPPSCTNAPPLVLCAIFNKLEAIAFDGILAQLKPISEVALQLMGIAQGASVVRCPLTFPSARSPLQARTNGQVLHAQLYVFCTAVIEGALSYLIRVLQRITSSISEPGHETEFFDLAWYHQAIRNLLSSDEKVCKDSEVELIANLGRLYDTDILRLQNTPGSSVIFYSQGVVHLLRSRKWHCTIQKWIHARDTLRYSCSTLMESVTDVFERAMRSVLLDWLLGNSEKYPDLQRALCRIFEWFSALAPWYQSIVNDNSKQTAACRMALPSPWRTVLERQFHYCITVCSLRPDAPQSLTSLLGVGTSTNKASRSYSASQLCDLFEEQVNQVMPIHRAIGQHTAQIWRAWRAYLRYPVMEKERTSPLHGTCKAWMWWPELELHDAGTDLIPNVHCFCNNITEANGESTLQTNHPLAFLPLPIHFHVRMGGTTLLSLLQKLDHGLGPQNIETYLALCTNTTEHTKWKEFLQHHDQLFSSESYDKFMQLYVNSPTSTD